MSATLAALALATLWLLAWAPFWCCCATCVTTFTVTVIGCNLATIAGVTVTVKQGGTTVGTGTTNSSGIATITATTATSGTATIEASPPTGYLLTSTTSSFNCGSQAVTISMTVDSANYICVACCNFPVPLTLHLTTAQGTRAITYSAGGWRATGTVSATVATNPLPTDKCTCSGFDYFYSKLTTVGGTSPLAYQLYCSGGSWRLRVGTGITAGFADCNTFTWAYSNSTTGGGAGVAADILLSGSCDPDAFSLTGTVPGSYTPSATCVDFSPCHDPCPGASAVYNFTVPLFDAGGVTVAL